MNLPVETKPALWGIAGGAIALAIIGFTWGGWVTGARSTADATQRANTAVVAALAPVCVERFKGATEVSANLAALKLVDSWSQGAYVEKGGWAALPGSNSPEQLSAVARACAALLTASVIGRAPGVTRCPGGGFPPHRLPGAMRSAFSSGTAAGDIGRGRRARGGTHRS